jgi:hypothetical protein
MPCDLARVAIVPKERIAFFLRVRSTTIHACYVGNHLRGIRRHSPEDHVRAILIELQLTADHRPYNTKIHRAV